MKGNVKVFEKRLFAAEQKLNALLSSEQPEVVKQDSLPVTEIMEELDDEGRVVSSSTTTPNEAAPMIMDVLKKAGVEMPSQANRRIEQSSRSTGSRVQEIEEEVEAPKVPRSESERVPDSTPEDINSERPTTSERSSIQSSQDSAESVSNVPTRGSSTQDVTSKSTDLDEDSEEDAPPVMEVNEPPEDAAFRREMLQYGLDEVGAVVAELDLDEDGSEYSIDDEDEYDYMEAETEDEEDEYGRTTRKVLDDDYHKQMLELEKKLNAKGLQNLGPDPSSLPDEVREELEKPSAIKSDVPEKIAQKGAKKKKVAFAEDLDIAPDTKPQSQSQSQAKSTIISEIPEVPAVQDMVMERGEPKATTPAETKPPKSISQFKSARNSGAPVIPDTQPAPEPPKPRPSFSNTTPSSLPLFPAKPSEPKPFSQPIPDSEPTTQPTQPEFPEGKTLADNIVERETSRSSVAPPDPEGLDDTLHRQEIATEFYRMRNRKIQQSGGFVEDEEQEFVPVEEPTRKVSRFKAARAK